MESDDYNQSNQDRQQMAQDDPNNVRLPIDTWGALYLESYDSNNMFASAKATAANTNDVDNTNEHDAEQTNDQNGDGSNNVNDHNEHEQSAVADNAANDDNNTIMEDENAETNNDGLIGHQERNINQIT